MSSLQGSICNQLLEQPKPEGYCCSFRLCRFNCIWFIFRIENRNQRPPCASAAEYTADRTNVFIQIFCCVLCHHVLYRRQSVSEQIYFERKQLDLKHSPAFHAPLQQQTEKHSSYSPCQQGAVVSACYSHLMIKILIIKLLGELLQREFHVCSDLATW